MANILFTVGVSIGIPLLLCVYACFQKRYMPFILGMLAFTVSQILLRIPILQYLGENSAAYSMFSVTNPVLFGLLIGLSAGLFEGIARYIFMCFFMKQRDWQAGFLFGAGHGGIEAVLFVGISALPMLFSPTMIAQSDMLFVGGLERFFAMLLHIGLSIIVLQGIVQKRFLYVVAAILIHGFTDALVVILPLYLPKEYVLVVIEGALVAIASAVLSYSLWIKRKGILM